MVESKMGLGYSDELIEAYRSEFGIGGGWWL